MRAAALLLVATLALSGCIDAGVQLIEDARRDAGVDESTEAPTATPQGPPTPRSPTPGPSPGPTIPSPTIPSPSPSPSPSPGPSPSPSPSPIPVTPSPSPSPSPTSPTPSPSPPPTPSARPWPVKGSFVRVHVAGPESEAAALWTYSGKDWSGRCERDGEDPVPYTSKDPPHWPLFDTRSPPPEGESVKVWYLEGCSIVNRTATYSGGFAAQASSFETTWDSATGLVLSWDADGDRGRLVATDAPLAPTPARGT
ncbi:MAG TPA: hypothetical protein VM370_06645 [Candidatus Thermoplasmatota archaeon]|nr:hypothetical protein [Candidatus Thermoplasmatota archaeon]